MCVATILLRKKYTYYHLRMCTMIYMIVIETNRSVLDYIGNTYWSLKPAEMHFKYISNR